MRNLTVILTIAALVVSSTNVLARVAVAGGGPPVLDACVVHIGASGIKASLKDIAKARTAVVHKLVGCNDVYVEEKFGASGQATAITDNDKLRVQLRANGVFPQDVIGIQKLHGKLIVYVYAPTT